MREHERYMDEALALAQEAADAGEVPVGCVVVDEAGQIIGRGRNRREACGDATAHAEIEAIREASRARGDWRLDRCRIYVTLEPCPMCAGAIINARIGELIFAAREAHSGACGSVIDLFFERFGHQPSVTEGVRRAESAALLQGFFQSRR